MSKQTFKRFVTYESGNFVLLKSGRIGMIDWCCSIVPPTYIIKFGADGPKIKGPNSIIQRKATPEEVEDAYPGVGYKP